MKLPISWLKEYVNIDGISIKEYMDKMTMSGSKVEGYETTCEGITNVVIGQIEEIKKHPDADKLKICQINVGSEILQIVTGADNVFEGAKIPVAMCGSRLAGGIKISKGKLRGIESFGMLCSEEEIGINVNDEKSHGILILEDDAKIGEEFVSFYDLKEDIVEFEITSNRPDCLGVIGLARETAATFKRTINIPTPKYHENSEEISSFLKVEVLNKEICKRYMARVVKNIKIAPSPLWMQRRLNRAGVRAINNIVDITNYVMLEYGQPMHAFDIDFVKGNEIIVRNASANETIVTLDGVERKLNENILVIADKEKANAVAGVMGGENSGVNENTSVVVFESANFHGVSVRKAAQSIGMRTESSGRFEKGIDPNLVALAMERALELVELLGVGEIVSGVIDVNNNTREEVKLPLESDRINEFLGTNIDKNEMIEILKSLDFKVENDIVTSPSFRVDITCFNDIAEEVLRIYGYDIIKSTTLTGVDTHGGFTAEQTFENKIKTYLSGMGFYEVYTYSFTNPKMFDMLRISENSELRNPVKILNPLGEENSIMRTTSIHSILEVLRTNYNRRNKDALVFEVANVYLKECEDTSKLPREERRVTFGGYGQMDYFDLKGALETLLGKLGIYDYELKVEDQNATFHPYRTATIYDKEGNYLGILGEIHPLTLVNYEVEEKSYICELSFDGLFKAASKEIKYKKLPKFPATTRDLAVLVEDDVLVSQIEGVIKKNASSILEQVNLFDVYKGKQIEEGKKSVAYSLAFRASDRTLTDEEVTKTMNKILKGLKEELNADLRL